ncbi:MAG TPA: lipoate--protein ligase family protein [Verrucomicrobiae bacterium]|nr:lipoate--protein ligase family protein [Verrucomicrobiae bacterium]
MNFLDLTLPSPAENLACDEVLLDLCENGAIGETLRFWESPEFFVVLGYSNRVETEANLAACRARKIPVMRRCSGGGTIVQGPGCLNYSLILKMDETGPLRNITSANAFIMEQNRAAIQSLVNAPVAIQGHTDLTINGLKFSGNSQRRRKRSLLFHGSFLLNFDLALIGELLPMPSAQPDYRRNRAHENFLTDLNIEPEKIREAFRRKWKAEKNFQTVPLKKIELCAREKYSSDEWNRRF